MDKRVISLTTEKELRIFMLPLRQQIIREMRIIGKPITAKKIADKLKITPSSAKHHLTKLQELGIVEFHHSELINGITANYMVLTDVDISIGQNLDDELSGERDAFSQNLFSQVYQGCQNVIRNNRGTSSNNCMAGLLSGLIHLSDDKMKELNSIIRKFINENEDIKENTNPYEFAMVYYRANLDNEDIKK